MVPSSIPVTLRGVAVLVLEHQLSILPLSVVLPVPDVVEDMKLAATLAKPNLQFTKRRDVHPFDFHQSALGQALEGGLDDLDFLLNIQMRVAGGAADHTEDPPEDPVRALLAFDVASPDGAQPGYRTASARKLGRSYRKLPGKFHQLGGIPERQNHPKTPAGLVDGFRRGSIAVPDRSIDERGKQATAELHGVVLQLALGGERSPPSDNPREPPRSSE